MKTKNSNSVKAIFIFLVLFTCNSLSLFSQTNVSGFISSNTHWTVGNSPYIITGNTILDSGFVLTIDPGVVVKFNTAKSLQISGTLKAEGTNINPINFTSNQTSPAQKDWDYILFNDQSSDYDTTLHTGCIMNYCIIEYAGASGVSYNGAIRINSSFPYISNCKIRNNGTVGIAVSYNDPGGGIIFITGCQIYNNDASSEGGNALAGAIRIEQNTSKSIIQNNIIYNNRGGASGGIHLSCVNNNTSVISNNLIHNNHAMTNYGTGGGIFAGWWGGIISYNIIYGNSAPQGGGIYLGANHGTITNNIIANNYAQEKGGAIYTSTNYFWPCDVQIFYNSIVENYSVSTSGIYSLDPQSSVIKFNTITRNHSTGNSLYHNTVSVNLNAANNSTYLFINNNLYSNFGDAPFYELYNGLAQNNGNINVNNCWWKKSSTTAIDSLIFDFLDDGTFGIVDYTPFLSSPDTIAPVTPPVHVIKTDIGGGKIKVMWNTNPDADIAGYKIYWGNPTGYSFSNSQDAGNNTTDTLTGLLITDTIAVTAYDHLANGNNDQFKGNESWYTYAIGKPIVTLSASTNTICKGETITFYDNTIDAAFWTWTFPGGNPSVSNAQNPQVIYNSAGNHSVYLTVSNIAGTDSSSVLNMITVNEIPTVTFSSLASTCLNSSEFAITGGAPSGGIYSGPGITNGNFNPAFTGTGTFNLLYIYTDVNGCGIDTAIHPITVYTNYIQNVSASVCNGETYIFPDGTTGDVNTVYSCTLNSINSCDSTIITTLNIDIVDTAIYVFGSQLVSNASGTYQWIECSNNNQPVVGATGQYFQATHTGSYAVIVTSNNCSDTSGCYYMYIDQISSLSPFRDISLHPNPAHHKTNLTIAAENSQNITIELINTFGEILYKNKLSPSARISKTIDVSWLSKGVYYLKLIGDEKFIYKKLIVE